MRHIHITRVHRAMSTTYPDVNGSGHFSARGPGAERAVSLKIRSNKPGQNFFSKESK